MFGASIITAPMSDEQKQALTAGFLGVPRSYVGGSGLSPQEQALRQQMSSQPPGTSGFGWGSPTTATKGGFFDQWLNQGNTGVTGAPSSYAPGSMPGGAGSNTSGGMGGYSPTGGVTGGGYQFTNRTSPGGAMENTSGGTTGDYHGPNPYAGTTSAPSTAPGTLGPNGMIPGGAPPGYQFGNFTGGGQYPLASVYGPGLMQPWTTPFQGGGMPSAMPFNWQGGMPSAMPFKPPVSPYQGGQFQAPTGVTEQNDPGYQFRLKQGTDAIQNSAAARGTLLSGGTLKDLQGYAQGLASDEYQNVFNRALTTSNTNYGRGAYENEQAYGRGLGENQMAYGRGFDLNNLGYGRALGENQMAYGRGFDLNNLGYGRNLGEYQQAYNIYNNNQGNQYSRLFNLGQLGAGAAGTLGQFGGQFANNQGDLYTGQGNAQAAGTVGGANAWQAGLGNASNAFQQWLMWQQMQGQRPGGGIPSGVPQGVPGGGYVPQWDQ